MYFVLFENNLTKSPCRAKHCELSSTGVKTKWKILFMIFDINVAEVVVSCLQDVRIVSVIKKDIITFHRDL